MVGNSPAMAEIFEQIRRFAACDMPVLITGESGTGKELVARAIHDHSGRAEGPFVALNCAAVPATLIASELFGYEKGAFTGASARKHGHIEHAHRGTLFLDEIGDMPIDLQGLLLRFLQEGEILRVGGRHPIRVDVRVVAATNVRLREAIAAGKLREDLYYRLNVLSIHLPPLRERDGDIELLATYFLRAIARELQRTVHGYTLAAMAALLSYPWPGNVRELIATVRRAVVLADGPLIDLPDLRLEPERLPTEAHSKAGARLRRRQSGTRPERGSDAERDAILQALQQSRFNMTRAAHALGVSRATLYRMLQRNRIELAQQFLVRGVEMAASED
jgi:transcriptional regulator with PAS, ATPase and Fis domain